MDRRTRLSRMVLAAVALAASAGLLSACTRPDAPDVLAFQCERISVRAATPTSLADALAQQAAVNKAYRQCVDRRGVRASR